MSNKKSGLGKFIAGATIGVGMGLLFAPKKGSETREELKCKIAAMQTDKEDAQSAENLTKILVDFVNDKQNDSKNTKNLCTADETETPL